MIAPSITQAFSINDLIERYKPESETFTVTLPGGEILHFRNLANYGELQAFKVRIAEFASSLRNGRCPESFSPYIPEDDASLIAAFTVSELSVEPTKIEHLQALQMTKATWLLEQLVTEIDRHRSRATAIALNDQVEQGKNESWLTECSAPDSPSAEMSTESTPTS